MFTDVLHASSSFNQSSQLPHEVSIFILSLFYSWRIWEANFAGRQRFKLKHFSPKVYSLNYYTKIICFKENSIKIITKTIIFWGPTGFTLGCFTFYN